MDLDEPWSRIVAWLTEHAPASAAQLRPPAPAEDLVAAQAGFARPWPRDLVRFYELCDGVEPSSRDLRLVPVAFRPAPVADLTVDARLRVTVFAELRAHGHLPGVPAPTTAERAPAGTVVHQWVPSYVPFAPDGLGGVLTVDLRPGEACGSVFDWDHVETDRALGRRPSLTALFHDLADCLEFGTAWEGSWAAVVDDGRLHWELTRA